MKNKSEIYNKIAEIKETKDEAYARAFKYGVYTILLGIEKDNEPNDPAFLSAKADGVAFVTDVYQKRFDADCERIAEECEAEGYPSHGTNYEVRVEQLKEYYHELFEPVEKRTVYEVCKLRPDGNIQVWNEMYSYEDAKYIVDSFPNSNLKIFCNGKEVA